jgi:1-acyl-sn-glycerol-3-phosphate acyltransferase
MALYSFLCVLSLPLPLRWRHAIIRAYLRVYMVVLKIVCRIDYKVEGLENIPADHRGVIMSKHQSTWETFFLPIIFHAPEA